MRQRLLIIGLALAVLAGIGVWLAKNLEQVQERNWVGFSGEARRNPWLASERLLERMGMRTAKARSVPELRSLPRDGLLVLPRRLETIHVDEQKKLLAWVEGGGHLVVEAEQPAQADPILDAVGIARKAVKRPRSASVQLAELPGAPHALMVQVGEWRTLEAASTPLLSLKGTQAVWMLQVGHGAGRVSAFTDLGFARNDGIGKLDHADFLWTFLRLEPRAAVVAFFHNPQKLSLLAWLRERAWAVLVAAALLLGAWLWHVAPRFGPIAPDPEPARRRLLDHLRASGRFQWSAGGAAALAEAARESVLRRIHRAHPDFAGLSPPQRAARLMALFGLPADAVQRVLQAAPAQNPAEFTAATSVYQHIHEQLSIAKERP
jgi:hypothetical protein